MEGIWGLIFKESISIEAIVLYILYLAFYCEIIEDLFFIYIFCYF